MSQRYFVESPIGQATATQLVDAEAQHLAKVMRAKVGDEVIVFDGSGWEFVGHVTAVGKSAVDLEIVERRNIDRELARPLTVAVALPKGDRQKTLVEKTVEIGVTRLIPLETERGVAEATPAALARLRRQVIEASKQCGRNRLMEIASPAALPDLVATGDERRVLAHPSGIALTAAVPATSTTIAVGPEGGFTDQEVALAAAAGWEIVSLGKRILRIETAAIALAALLAQQG